MMGGNVVSPHTPFPRAYPAASGRGIENLIKLPTEDETIRAQARIIGFGSRGLHCKFIHLGRKSQEAIEYCFNVAKHTLPIR